MPIKEPAGESYVIGAVDRTLRIKEPGLMRQVIFFDRNKEGTINKCCAIDRNMSCKNRVGHSDFGETQIKV